MKRIAALALVAALGATAASAEEIKPVTSTQAPIFLGGIFGGASAVTIAGIIASAIVIGVVVTDDNSGT